MSQHLRDDENPLSRYIIKHGRAPSYTLSNDKSERIRVEYHRGYISITLFGADSRQRTHVQFYITRNAWIKILRHSLRYVKYQDQQFSVSRAIRRMAALEKEWLDELRQQKRSRRRSTP